MPADAHPGLHVLALLKQVPHHDTIAELGEDGRLNRAGLPTELNPFCRRAAALAVRVAQQTGGTSTALTMGPPSALDVLQEAQACGIDRTVLLSDPGLAGSDCLATARALAAAISTLPAPDLILVGRSSLDADTGLTGPMLAEALGVAFVGPAITLEVSVLDGRPVLDATLQQDAAEVQVQVRGPAVVAVAERATSPAKAAPDTWPQPPTARRITTADLGDGPWGTAGSGTIVAGVRSSSTRRAAARMPGELTEQITRAVDLLVERGTFDDAETEPEPSPPVPAQRGAAGPAIVALIEGEAAGRALLTECAVVAHRIGGHVVAAGAITDPSTAARWGADTTLELAGDDPRSVAALVARIFPDAWAVVGPATDWGREVLARLAVRVRGGVIADAVSLDVELADGAAFLIGTKPCAGAAVAEIVCHTTTRLATVRIGALPPRSPRELTRTPEHERLHLPPDLDVSYLSRRTVDDTDALDRAQMVIGLGRGVQPERYAELEPLRELLGARFAATRAVTDAGWLPHGRQVGITARSIAPRLYVAIGIGGSSNHLAGLSRTHTVLAINADPAAAIFDAADIGIVADWTQAVPALAAELAARGIGASRPRVPAEV